MILLMLMIFWIRTRLISIFFFLIYIKKNNTMKIKRFNELNEGLFNRLKDNNMIN